MALVKLTSIFLFIVLVQSRYTYKDISEPKIYSLEEHDMYHLAGYPTTWIIQFYDPIKINLTSLTPLLQSTVDLLQAKNMNSVTVSTLNCRRQKEHWKRYKISNYTNSLIINHKGVDYFYDSEENAESVIKFVTDLEFDTKKQNLIEVEPSEVLGYK